MDSKGSDEFVKDCKLGKQAFWIYRLLIIMVRYLLEDGVRD